MSTKSKKLMVLATDLLVRGEIEEAIEALRRSTRLGNSEDMKIYIDVASSLYKQNDYDNSKILLEAFLKDWSCPEAYFMLGEIECKKLNIENAIKYYKSGLSNYKQDALLPYHRYAELYLEIKDIEKSASVYKSIISKKENDEEALSFLGKYYKDKKDYKSASWYYEKIEKYDFGVSVDYQNYGLCLYETGEYKKSEKMYIKAVELFPADSEKTQSLKNLRNKNLQDLYPNLENSEQEYKDSIDKEPSSTSYFHLGNIAFIKGDYQEAARLYEKAKEVYSSVDMNLAV